MIALQMLFVPSVLAAEKTVVRVAGSGAMIPLLTDLARAYMERRNDVLIVVNQKSIQSTGGFLGASKGEIEIGMANRPLKEEEKDLSLKVVNIAQVGIVIGVNKNVPIKGITGEELCSIYSGRITNWKELGGKDEKIVALTKVESDTVKAIIRKSVPCFKDLKESPTVIVIPASPETAKALSSSRAIGFTDLSYVKASKDTIAALKFDGIEPTVENIKKGNYKITQTFSLATKGAPTGAVKDFVEFIRGPQGAKIMSSFFAIPLK
jgi:phosphate transport system substrate-binding protein